MEPFFTLIGTVRPTVSSRPLGRAAHARVPTRTENAVDMRIPFSWYTYNTWGPPAYKVLNL